MISVAEATSIILSHPFSPNVETIDLRASCGRILAKALIADRDLPPYERVSMDGIAIRYSSFQNGTRQFPVENIQAAGMPQLALEDSESCIEVMTGASLPIGTDTVVRYEDIEVKNRTATILITDISPRQNIHPKGRDAGKGQELLAPGIVISPAEINLLASAGRSMVSVIALPKTAIVSTGDELVDIDKTPLPHQIRRSNDAALSAALYDMGCVADQFHLTDSVEVLQKKISDIFETYPLVILSGGVSKGKFDFVPQVLDALGVRKLFHQVSQKPGKPFWFGTTNNHTVFALPGNPVSTYMCFYRYIRPWLMQSMGVEARTVHAILAKDFSFKPALTYFLQVNARNEQGRLMAWPEEGGGSGDFANLRGVNGFLELPLERNEFKAGETFPFIPFRKSI